GPGSRPETRPLPAQLDQVEGVQEHFAIVARPRPTSPAAKRRGIKLGGPRLAAAARKASLAACGVKAARGGDWSDVQSPPSCGARLRTEGIAAAFNWKKGDRFAIGGVSPCAPKR